MPNFTALAFVDIWELSCSLRPRVGLFKAGEPRVLYLRGPRANADDPDDDLAYVRSRELAKWPEATNTITRLTRLGTQAFGPIDLGRVFVEMLEPDTTLPWTRRTGAYVERFTRLYVALRTNPGTILFSGTEGWHLQQGQAVAVNQRVPTSAVNLGDHWAAHLVLDFCRRPEADDGDE